MTLRAPPRPPRPPDPVEREELEALIEEARRRARRRRLTYVAGLAVAAVVGLALFAVFERTALSGDASSAPGTRSSAAGTPGSKIAFMRLMNGSRLEYSYELYVMNADGSGKRRLARSPWAGNAGLFRASPAWSPDGRKLVFAIQLRGSGGLCDRAGPCNDEIYVINAAGSGLRRLTWNAVPDGQPAWSPDGQKIAFLSWRDGTGADVFVMNADGSGQRNLTRKPGEERGPAWSPDGRAIAFTRVPDGPRIGDSADGPYRDVYVMNADGSGQRNLTHTQEAGEGGAAWSPDGQPSPSASTTGRRGGSGSSS